MIEQNVYIREAEWDVKIFYDAHPKDAERIINALWNTGCAEKNLYKASRLLRSGVPNEGLTYSNPLTRRTVMVIGHTDCALEFFNSLAHESQHLEQAICEADGLDPYGEDIAYISGDISQSIARNAWLNVRKLFLYLL